MEGLGTEGSSAAPGRRNPAMGLDFNAVPRRALLRVLAAAPMATALAACGGGGSTADEPTALAPPAARTWRMGFGSLPPRFDVDTLLASIGQWAPRAELAAIQEELPWTALLNGADAGALVDEILLPRVRHYRALGLKVLFVAELNDGLAREAEAPQLRAMGRTLAEPEVQDAWLRYVVAASQRLELDWLCLAAETNLVRLIAPPALYRAIRQCAVKGAAAIRAAGGARRPVLMTSVQVEAAWGRMPWQDGTFAGVDADLGDFGFTECLGLSSYPFLAHGTPEEVPLQWYARLAAASGLPALVTECGWSSAGASSQNLQQRYISCHASWLDEVGAIGMIQAFYADLDLNHLPIPIPPNLPTFAQLGLTGAQFEPKAALAAWDRLFARPIAA